MKVGIAVLAAVTLSGQVLTRSGDNQHTGVYQDSILTPQNVSKLHKIRSIPIPNDKRGIESQPLALTLTINKKSVDLLVLSTMANDVLGCDLKTGQVLWTTNLGKPIQGSKKIDFWGLNDHWGVLSTGVIDKDDNLWYGVAWSSPDGTPEKGWHSLHAIDLTTGKEVKPPLSMNPLSYDSGQGVVRFAGQMRKQRGALTLQSIAGRKVLAVVSGSVLETAQGASGWVAFADLDAWRFTASWSASIKTFGGGIWMAGQGLASDEEGVFYGLTGNGGFDGKTEFSESFIKLKYIPPENPAKDMGRLDILDWWSPYSDAGRAGQDPTLTVIQKNYVPNLVRPTGVNASTQDGGVGVPVNHGHAHEHALEDPPWKKFAKWNDQDLGSGAIVLLSKLGIVGGAGKDGIWYAVNEDDLGKTQPQDFRNPAANYAKLLSPPAWFTYAAFKHNAQGQVIGYEDAAPQDVTKLNFTYDGVTHHMHSTPVAFESARGTFLYCWGENGNLRAWQVGDKGALKFLANGAELSSPWSPKSAGGGMPGGMLALSANHTQNAILWALVPMGDSNRELTPGKLYAYDATNFGKYSDGAGQIKLLYQSPDNAFLHAKFNTPIIYHGYVVVPTYNGRVDVYGL
jgi:hypothetical protein